MFFLIGKNPYYDDLNKHTNQNYINKQIEAIEIQLKKKYEKIDDFDPEDCYNSQNSDDINFGDSDGFNISELPSDTIEKEADKIKKRIHRRDSNTKKNTPTLKRPTYLQNKMSTYLNFMKIFDILAVILILVGGALSQYEQDIYYYDNILYRVTGVVMMNYVYNNPTNHSLRLIFSENNVNLTLVTFNPYLNNSVSPINQNDMHNRNDMTNSQNPNNLILSSLNMSQFNYAENITDYSLINIPLEVSPQSAKVRYIILLTTLTSCLLIFCSRYLEHKRNYNFKNEQELIFYKGDYFVYGLVEIFVLLLIQFPGVNSYIIFPQLGACFCIPISTMLASISIFRAIFILKLLKHFSVWNSEIAENKCENFSCQADIRFAFKAIQKENPLFTLLIIFILTCLCFGFSLRNFELHYWEAQSEVSQNWSYYWNAMWCVFVSMTTVGYGDFYPKTHPGRFIIVFACLIGIYFVSMMMVLMTHRSILNESEQKAYKLITRLKLRREIKDILSTMVMHSLEIALLKKLKTNHEIEEREFEMKHNHERRCIMELIEQKKAKERNIKRFEFIPTKEQLFDICQRIDSDIKEIRNEFESLSYINDSIVGYTESQADMLRYLKKNIYATKLMFEMIDKKPSSFGKLAYYDPDVLLEDDVSAQRNLNMTYTTNLLNNTRMPDQYYKSNKNLSSVYSSDKNSLDSKNLNISDLSNKDHKDVISDKDEFLHNVVNPNQFDENINKKNNGPIRNESQSQEGDEHYAEELINYNVSPEEMKEHFYHLFFNQNDGRTDKRPALKKTTINTMKNIKKLKSTQNKLRMLASVKNRRKSVSASSIAGKMSDGESIFVKEN